MHAAMPGHISLASRARGRALGTSLAMIRQRVGSLRNNDPGLLDPLRRQIDRAGDEGQAQKALPASARHVEAPSAGTH